MNEIPAAGETFRGDDGTVSTILPASYGQDYEASDGELEEYAEYIGIDAAKEPELMWIAQEGLRAPLPDGWRACQTDDNEVYYFNFQSGDSLWDHPMDEHYKNKVIAERARHRKGGVTAAAAVSAVSSGTRTGTTKALTDSLFLKPAGGTSGPLTINTAGSAASSTDAGASAPRPGPDVSDILSLAATVASPLGPSGSRAPPAPLKLKEAETAMRKRLEEQNEAQLRTLRIDYGKKEDAERQKLEETRARLQRELDSTWEREKSSIGGSGAPGSSTASATTTTATATQRRLQTAREVKQLEESWKSRLHDVSKRVTDLQQRMETQQQALQKSIYQPPEELKKALEARNAAELAQLREAARRQAEVTLQRLKSEHAAEQAKTAAKTAETVAAAERLAESTTAQRTQERKVQNAAMLAALQAAVEAKKAELAAKEKALPSGAASGSAGEAAGTGGASPKQPGLSETDRAAIAAAQAAADAEVAEVRRVNALALTRLKEELEGRRREREAALRNAPSSRPSSTMQTPTRGLSKASSNSSFSVNAVSPGEQLKLDEEDQKLKEEAEKAARVYEEETELMVANREAGRSLTAAPLASAAANVSADAVAALSRTAAQAQRARDAENGRHSMAVKQLEAKHEQAVRLIKAQHDKAVAATTNSTTTATAPFNPRQHPAFAAQLNARKRSWTRDHPAPAMEMPTLTPIPTLPVATLNTTMAAAAMPDTEEQARIVKTRLAQTRDELRHKFDREVQALQRGKEGELAEWQASYRAGRLAAVQEAMTALKKEKDAEVQAAQVKAREVAEASTSAAAAAQAAAQAATSARREADAKAAAAAQAKLQGLEEKLRTAETQAASSEREGRAGVAALEAEIAHLEETLLRLTREVDTEEKRREELRAKSAAVAAETEVLLQSKAAVTPAIAPPPPSSAAVVAPSMALFIADAEAAEEEAALRARWTALLASLRTAVQHEMGAYERTLAEISSAAAQAAQVESTGAAASSLPPTAPVSAGSGGSAAGPPFQSSLQGGGGVSSVGFATPLQRPPLSSTADPRGPLANGGGVNPDARLFAPSPQQQQQLEQQRYALHLQQQQQQQQQQAWADISGVAPGMGGMRFFDPSMTAVQRGPPQQNVRTALPSSYYGAGDDSGVFAPPQRQSISQHSQLPSQRSTDDDQAVRLAALQQALRERRHELQAQRREMEQLREEWREDMRQCEQRNDKAQAQKLRAVKAVLEERASRLNEKVLEQKAMQHEVQSEMRQYSQWMQQRQQGGSEGTRHGTVNSSSAYALAHEDRERDPSPFGGRRSGASTSASTADVVGFLESIVARTERLENLLLRSARAEKDSTPSPRRGAARR